MTSPVTVEQVVDVDTWIVQVHADPTAELVTRLCHDLDRHSGARHLVSHLTPDHPEHQKALAALIFALADTFTWTLDQSQAQEFDKDVYEAAVPPEQCHYCESYMVAPIDGVPLCHRHAAAADRAAEASAS